MLLAAKRQVHKHLVQRRVSLSGRSLIHRVQERSNACKYTHAHGTCMHTFSKKNSRFWGKLTRSGDRKQGIFLVRPYVMEKPSRCWQGAVPRYWKVVASCFQIVSFAENTSVPLAPRARISQPILLLFFCFLPLEFVYKTVSQIFFIPSQNLVAFKRRWNWLKKGYFRTFPNV